MDLTGKESERSDRTSKLEQENRKIQKKAGELARFIAIDKDGLLF